jgi:hypothetical protein
MPRNVEQSETKKQQLDNEDEEIIDLRDMLGKNSPDS